MTHHWDDVLSDFSVLHRLDESQVEELTPRQFFPRAFRLVHYQGATRDVAMAARHKGPAPEQVQPGSAPTTEVQPTSESVLQDPTAEQIKALRDAARRKRFPKDKFGDVTYVSAEDIVREAGNSG